MEWHPRLGYTWWMSVLAFASINSLNRWAISGAQRLQNCHSPLRRYLWYVSICWPDQEGAHFHTGWVVLSGKTHIKDPLSNFRHVFSGSSHSSNDVRLNSSFDKTFLLEYLWYITISTQRPLSKSSTHTLGGKVSTMSWITSGIPCERLKLLVHLD